MTVDLAAVRADLDRLIGREQAAGRVTAPGRTIIAAARVEAAFRSMYPALAALRDQPADDTITAVPTHLLGSVLADARCQIARARGERALLAAPGSPEARVGDVGEAIWRGLNPGLAGLLDWAGAQTKRATP
ncbi:MAG TPA: hypothetical protein VLJ88_18560, partial [Propionibacteriaceae bacterium]|nr:hypothetical protein [Propionibacteriaceae bacterium]